jgi:PAS domain S-box-containing protein
LPRTCGGSGLIWTPRTDCHETYFNEPWLRFTGQSPAGQLAAGWAAGFHPVDLDHCRRTQDSHFDRRQPFRIAYRLRASDGAYRWIENAGTPHFDRAGDFIGDIDFCQDISELRLVEGTATPPADSTRAARSQTIPWE